jgi:hypothetical protein
MYANGVRQLQFIEHILAEKKFDGPVFIQVQEE